MNDAPFMGVIEGPAHRYNESYFFQNAKGRTALDQFLKAFAFQILHGDEGSVSFLAQFVDGDDVGVFQSSRRAGFSIKALQKFRIADQSASDGLQSHWAANQGIESLIDLAHGPAAHNLN